MTANRRQVCPTASPAVDFPSACSWRPPCRRGHPPAGIRGTGGRAPLGAAPPAGKLGAVVRESGVGGHCPSPRRRQARNPCCAQANEYVFFRWGTQSVSGQTRKVHKNKKCGETTPLGVKLNPLFFRHTDASGDLLALGGCGVHAARVARDESPGQERRVGFPANNQPPPATSPTDGLRRDHPPR